MRNVEITYDALGGVTNMHIDGVLRQVWTGGMSEGDKTRISTYIKQLEGKAFTEETKKRAGTTNVIYFCDLNGVVIEQPMMVVADYEDAVRITAELNAWYINFVLRDDKCPYELAIGLFRPRHLQNGEAFYHCVVPIH